MKFEVNFTKSELYRIEGGFRPEITRDCMTG